MDGANLVDLGPEHFEPSGYWLFGSRELWGGQGQFLINYHEWHRDSDGNGVGSRSGPFVPMLCEFGWRWAVSEEARRRLEDERIHGLSFKPIRYDDIRFIPWHTWDFEAEMPAGYSDGGELKSLFSHASPMGTLEVQAMERSWEIEAPFKRVRIHLVPLLCRQYFGFDYWIEDAGPHPTIFDARGDGHRIVCDDEAKIRFGRALGSWIDFIPIMCVKAG